MSSEFVSEVDHDRITRIATWLCGQERGLLPGAVASVLTVFAERAGSQDMPLEVGTDLEGYLGDALGRVTEQLLFGPAVVQHLAPELPAAGHEGQGEA